MVALRAAWRGIGRALASPKLLLWLWAANLLAALPAAVVVEEAIHREIGASRVEERLRDGFDMAWYGEYRHRARGLEDSFTPTHSGPGAFFANLDHWLRGDLLELPPALVATGVAWALLWVLLLGGVLEQWVRPAPRLELGRFLSAAGRYFFRLLRLAALTVGLYYGVYRLARALFPRLEELTQTATRESTVLAAYLAGAAVVVALLALVRTIADYAKIALVGEERRSSLFALLAGARFVLLPPVRTGGVALLFGLAAAAALAAYALVAPGAGAADAGALAAAVGIGQLYLVVKLLLRLGLLGAEVTVYQGAARDTLPPPL